MKICLIYQVNITTPMTATNPHSATLTDEDRTELSEYRTILHEADTILISTSAINIDPRFRPAEPLTDDAQLELSVYQDILQELDRIRETNMSDADRLGALRTAFEESALLLMENFCLPDPNEY